MISDQYAQRYAEMMAEMNDEPEATDAYALDYDQRSAVVEAATSEMAQHCAAMEADTATRGLARSR